MFLSLKNDHKQGRLLDFNTLKSCYDFHLAYLSFRIAGINIIKEFSSLFRVKKEIVFKAIYLMDRIYLSNDEVKENDIEDISKICLIISIKFSEISLSYPLKKLIEKTKITDYHIKEIKCLELLSYCLSDLTSYDWLISFITTEFKQNSKIILREVYQKAICLLREVVEDIRFLDFKPRDIALCLLKITSQRLEIKLTLDKDVDLKYNNNVYFVFQRIITHSHLIVFIPKLSPIYDYIDNNNDKDYGKDNDKYKDKDDKCNGSKSASDYDSSSTSDSNDLSLDMLNKKY